jgi:hypothetical protein
MRELHDPIHIGIEYSADQTLQNVVLGTTRDLLVGQSFVTTVGFPQIALCKTRFQFPCGVVNPTPETAQHVLEALGIPPEPITAPLRRGQTGNPVPSSYPRLLTLDRDDQAVTDARRRRSTRPYVCRPSSTQDKDEYPPASVVENFSSAHIKCINYRDNRRAGNSMGTQYNAYSTTSTGSGVKLPDGTTIEFVILP